MKKCLPFLVLATAMLLGTSTATADVVDFLDFSNDGDGAIHNTTGNSLPNPPISGGSAPNDWVLSYDSQNIETDATTNEFQAIGGVLRVQDWGGVGTLTGQWTATEDGTMTIEGIGQAIGSAPFNSTVSNGPGIFVTEGITWFYQINADPVVQVVLDRVALTGDAGTPVNAGDSVDNSFNDVAVSAGDVVQYGFSVAVNGAGDGVEISSVTIDFTQAIPEPTSMLILGLGMVGLICQRRRS